MMSATLTREAALTGFSREAVEALSHWKQEPEWVLAARLAAWETYEQLPMPKRTDEEWRRTDTRTLKLDVLRPFVSENGAAAPVGIEGLGSDGGANAGANNGMNNGTVGTAAGTANQGSMSSSAPAHGGTGAAGTGAAHSGS